MYKAYNDAQTKRAQEWMRLNKSRIESKKNKSSLELELGERILELKQSNPDLYYNIEEGL